MWLYTTRKTRIEGANLVLIFEQVEDSGAEPATYTKAVKQVVDGKLKTISTTTLTRKDARSSRASS